jgi:hypothetical protein
MKATNSIIDVDEEGRRQTIRQKKRNDISAFSPSRSCFPLAFHVCRGRALTKWGILVRRLKEKEEKSVPM